MYTEKLSCVGLSLKDDPYLPENEAKFAGDRTTCFKVDYGASLLCLNKLEYTSNKSCHQGNNLMLSNVVC